MTNDYSNVISASDYTQGLSEHVDIPQSDEGIFSVIEELAKNKSGEEFKILDLGCGPGRLTQTISKRLENICKYEVVGLDISEGFISFAKANKPYPHTHYLCVDFLSHDFKDQEFDVILMQGLFHHIKPILRQEWLKRCKNILVPQGKIIIGDEFIPDFTNEEDRVDKVVGLYAYVIAEALQAHNESLASIESMNMVDDVSSGTPGAGYSDLELIRYIQEKSKVIYKLAITSGTEAQVFQNLLRETATYIKIRSAEIAVNAPMNHDRGDYKISVKRQQEELLSLNMKIIEIRQYGPVDWLGGMGVLVFEEK